MSVQAEKQSLAKQAAGEGKKEPAPSQLPSGFQTHVRPRTVPLDSIHAHGSAMTCTCPILQCGALPHAQWRHQVSCSQQGWFRVRLKSKLTRCFALVADAAERHGVPKQPLHAGGPACQTICCGVFAQAAMRATGGPVALRSCAFVNMQSFSGMPTSQGYHPPQ